MLKPLTEEEKKTEWESLKKALKEEYNKTKALKEKIDNLMNGKQEILTDNDYYSISNALYFKITSIERDHSDWK